MRFVLTLLLPCIVGCFPYQRDIDRNRAKVLSANPDAPHYLDFSNRRIHYIKVGAGNQIVFFVHGSPGSWEAFAGFLSDDELKSQATLVAVDRPGFGKTSPETAERSLEVQSRLLRGVLESEARQIRAQRVILVGHSFGGPVIAHMAAEYTMSKLGLIFVAPAVDPNLERVTWYQTVGDWRWVRWLLPRVIDNANQEILPLKTELSKLVPLWQKIRSPTIVLQGRDDSLVSPENADFILRQLGERQVRIYLIPDQGHFIPWEKPHLIKEAILTLLSRS